MRTGEARVRVTLPERRFFGSPSPREIVRYPLSEAPEVSVVIPTRDRWMLLSTHAIPTALAQEDVDFEVIVVDDGSTDGTSSSLAKWNDPRLRIIRHEESRGVAAARNAGIAVARAEWIAFLDDDDLWSPRKLRAQLDVALHGRADLVYAAAVLVDEHRSVLAADVFPEVSELMSILLDGNVVPGGCSNVLARTSLVRDVGCFDEQLTYTEDWDLWIRLVRAGEVAVCPDVLVAHVDHRGNALFRYRPDVLSEIEYVLIKYNPGLDRADIRARRVGALEWMAHEYRRAGFRWEAARVYLRIARERRRVGDVARALVVLSGTSGARAVRLLLRVTRRRVGDGPGPAPSPSWLERHEDSRVGVQGP